MGVLRVPILTLCLIGGVLADVYLQNPRGSNNRLDENTANRNNAKRLFDSQNNDKGGYNTGDRLKKDFGSVVKRQYAMQYYGSGGASSEDTKLLVEWTNQHGCGGNEKNLCNIVIQYMCMNNGTDSDYPTESSDSDEDVEERVLYMRDGTSTDRPDYNKPSKNENDTSYTSRMENNYEDRIDKKEGLHETVWWYDTCRYREANGGLFTADQDLKKDKVGYVTASRTRQNNDGDRSGYECPEERDYFPYWGPTWQTEEINERFQRTPWIDLAWLGDKDKCSYIKENSFNQNSKYRCVLDGERKYGRSITENDCSDEGGTWVEFRSYLEVLTDITNRSDCRSANNADNRNKISWRKLRSDSEEASCIVQAPELECDDAPWTRVNHLGNSYSSGWGDSQKPNASRLEVDLPYFPSGVSKRCVMRVRYNISTDDYDPWETDSSSNDDEDVIENNPEIDVLGNGEELNLALNTAQTGRTFQDRSHVFIILPRLDSMEGKTIYNLNVRGKRGNIVQTFPATEYDFIPDRLTVGKNDLVHIQWTGSNSHDNNNDGDAGEGTGGTDRHNFLQMEALDESYPLTLQNADFWDNVESLTDPDASGKDIAIGLATSGYYCAQRETDGCPAEYTIEGSTRSKIDGTLDNAPASYFGHVLKFNAAGTIFYMCSRNNNFSNRSQKGALWVSNSTEEEE